MIIIIQDIPQIKEMYKDNYETILANCDSTIVLGANDQTTAEYISKLLGKSTITSRSFNRKKGNPMSSGVNLQQTGRELMMPDELRAMDNRYCIVLIRAEKPFYDEKYDLSKHPNYIYTGDYNKENAVEITDNDSLYNFVDKTYQKIEESGKESDEAENEISQPIRLRTIKDMFSTIDDYERKDAVNYMLQTQNAIIIAAEVCYKKKKKVMCMHVQVDINLVAPYLEMLNKKYNKSVIIFANTPPVGCLKGLFVDPSGTIQSDFRTAGYKFSICADYESSPDNLKIFETERINADKYNDICLLLENDNIPLTDLL